MGEGTAHGRCGETQGVYANSSAIAPGTKDPALTALSRPRMAIKTTRNSAWLTTVGLSLLVILGGFLRLYSLDAKSVTHVEMYVPGIHLPHGISVPEERLT